MCLGPAYVPKRRSKPFMTPLLKPGFCFARSYKQECPRIVKFNIRFHSNSSAIYLVVDIESNSVSHVSISTFVSDRIDKPRLPLRRQHLRSGQTASCCARDVMIPWCFLCYADGVGNHLSADHNHKLTYELKWTGTRDIMVRRACRPTTGTTRVSPRLEESYGKYGVAPLLYWRVVVGISHCPKTKPNAHCTHVDMTILVTGQTYPDARRQFHHGQYLLRVSVQHRSFL